MLLGRTVFKLLDAEKTLGAKKLKLLVWIIEHDGASFGESLDDIVKNTNFSRSTVHDLLYDLKDLDLIFKVEDGYHFNLREKE